VGFVLDLDKFPAALRAGLSVLAQDMAAHGTQRDDPAREVMAMLGDRWTSARLSAEQAISQRVLTLKLRALERNGFVLRHVTGDVPPKVSYSLSPLGVELAGEGRRMVDWANAREGAIHNARKAFDAMGD
jgi:DNA-binding HxlR family transcriptional regulator